MKVAINMNNLKKILIEKGWDEKRLAEEMGVSYVTVYRVLEGQRGPGNEFIAKLLKACNVEFEELFILEKSLPKGNENN